MRTRSHNQNKFTRIITIPIKVLGKAKELYVRSMNSVERVGFGGTIGGPAGQFSSLPKSFSVRSSRCNDDDHDDYSDLIRAASAKSFGNRIDMDLILQQQARNSQISSSSSSSNTFNNKGLPKCSSVGMSKIDEERPCDDFGDGQDDDDDVEPEFLYPRSRSYAVTKRNNIVF